MKSYAKGFFLVMFGMVLGVLSVLTLSQALSDTKTAPAKTVFKPGGKLKAQPADNVTITAKIVVNECCINFVANDETCNLHYVDASLNPIGEVITVRFPGDASKPVTRTDTGAVLNATVPAAADNSRTNHVNAINSLKATAATGGLFNR